MIQLISLIRLARLPGLWLCRQFTSHRADRCTSQSDSDSLPIGIQPVSSSYSSALMYPLLFVSSWILGRLFLIGNLSGICYS